MKNIPKILAFYSPHPRAGKTTAMGHLVYGDGIETPDVCAIDISFADPLRSMASELFASVDLLFSRVESENKDAPIPELGGLSLRDVLIWLGNSGRERMGSDIWSRVMQHKIGISQADVVVIDDLRFPVEYKMLREMGAKIVRISVPGAVIVPSETEALLEGFEFDFEIINKWGDFQNLYGRVEDAYSTLIGSEK